MLTGFFMFCNAMFLLAQDTVAKDSLPEKRIDHLTMRKVRGKYVYQTNHGYIKMKIRGNHYKRRGLTYFGWCIDKGRVEIHNDTLVLIENWDRDQPFARKERDTTAHRLTMVMVSNDLYYIYQHDSSYARGGKYIPIHDWRKWKRHRRRRI